LRSQEAAVKRINEQEVIYNEMVKEFDRMEKDYSRKLNRKDRTIAKKDSENKKLREMLLATGMSQEAIDLGLST
jgi:hypothetical protein